MRPCRYKLLSIICALLLPYSVSAETGDVVEEYRLKSALIYNFSQYIDWPADAFAGPDSPFEICIIGRNPFGESMQAIQQRRYQSRAIVLRYPATINEAKTCEILYADNPHEMLQGRVAVKALSEYHMLTVSSSPDAMEAGIGIGFVSQAGRVRWTLNLNAVQKSRLKVSAKLIEIAVEIVGEAKR